MDYWSTQVIYKIVSSIVSIYAIASTKCSFLFYSYLLAAHLAQPSLTCQKNAHFSRSTKTSVEDTHTNFSLNNKEGRVPMNTANKQKYCISHKNKLGYAHLYDMVKLVTLNFFFLFVLRFMDRNFGWYKNFDRHFTHCQEYLLELLEQPNKNTCYKSL